MSRPEWVDDEPSLALGGASASAAERVPDVALGGVFSQSLSSVNQLTPQLTTDPLYHLKRATQKQTSPRSAAAAASPSSPPMSPKSAPAQPASPREVTADALLTQGELSFATLDRIVQQLASDCEGADAAATPTVLKRSGLKRSQSKQASMREGTKATRSRSAHLVVGLLKLWPVEQVLDAMARARVGASLVTVWLHWCYPRCVQGNAAAVEAVAALLSMNPSLQDQFASLSQPSRVASSPRMAARHVGRSNSVSSMKAPSLRTLAAEPEDMRVLDFTADEVAAELTRLSLEALRQMGPVQLLSREPKVVATGRDRRRAVQMQELPMLFQVRQRTTRLAAWCASCVLQETDAARRAKTYQRMIAIAVALINQHRNLHDAVAIVCALHNPAVSRQKFATAPAPADALRRLTDLVRPPYAALRARLALWEEEERAFVAPLEIVLQDIFKLDEVESDWKPHPSTPTLQLGNVHKALLVGGWLTRFLEGFLHRTLAVEATAGNPRAAALVRKLPHALDDAQLWTLSKSLDSQE